MSDYEPAGLEARENADGLAYEEWRDRMRADDDEHDDGERVVAIREDGTTRTEPDEEPNDWREERQR